MFKKGLSFALLMAGATCFAATNLIPNGDFLDLDANGRPVGWWGVMDPQSGVDTAVHPEGKNAYRITDSGKMLSTRVPVEGGKVYQVSYLLKTDSFKWLSAASFQILWCGADGKPLFHDIDGKPHWVMKIKNTQGGHNWTPIEMTDCAAPADAASAEIRLGIVFESVGSAWFTGITMAEAEAGDSFANRIAAIPFDESPMAMADFFNDGHWRRSAELADFIEPATGTRAKYQTQIKAKYDGEALYLNIQAFQPGSDSLMADNPNNFDQQDAVEIFLLPPGAEFQHHLLLNPNSNLFACTEKWNDGHWPMKLHPWPSNGVSHVIRYFPGFWQAGFRIPFAGMRQARPEPGAAWRASFGRSVYTGGRETSAWPFLKEPHFQYSGDFGQIVFEQDIPLLRNIRLTGDGASLEIDNPSRAPVDLRLSFVRHAPGSASLTAPQSATVAPGQHKIVSLQEAAAGSAMRFFEVRQGARLLAKHCNMPSEVYAALGLFDPEGVRGSVINLAVDTPFFMAFNFRHNLDAPPPHKLLHRKDAPFDLFLELPDSVKLSGLMFDAGTWLQTPLIKPDVRPSPTRGLTVYAFELPFIINWQEPSFLFFYECDAPAGRELAGSYYLARRGEPLPKHELRFRTVRVGKVKRTPGRFVHEAVLMGANVLYYWLPRDPIESYRALGLNRVSIMVEPGRPDGAFYAGEQPKTREDFYDLLIRDIKAGQHKLFMTTISTSAGPQAWQWTRDDPDARALGVDGKEAPRNQYNYPSLCPTYRGAHFQAYTDRLVRSYAFRKYRCTWLALDMELWPPAVWQAICYCPGCLAKFKEYCQQHKPEWADRDPRAVMKENKDEAFKAFWEEFKTENYRDFLATAINRVKASVEGCPSTSPRAGFATEDWSAPKKKYEGLISYFEVPLYNSPDVNFKGLQRRIGSWGPERRDLIYSTTLGQTAACPDFHVTPVQVKEQLFEAAAFGMQGMLWYYHLYMEPLRWKYVIEGIDALARVEDIVLDGRMADTIGSDNPGLQLTRREFKGQSVLGVRAYGADRNLAGAITLGPVSRALSVYDCDTQEQVGAVTPENPAFTITVPKDRCRLLYVGTPAEWAKRRN